MLSKFLDNVKSFAIARSLMSAIELNIFEQLELPLSRAELRQRLGLADTPITDAFFDVLIAFQIFSEENDRLTLLPLGKSVLPVYKNIQTWNKEMQLFYTSLNDLTGLLRSGYHQDSVLSDYWVYTKSPERKTLNTSSVEEYSSLMEASQAQLSQLIVEHYDFSVHKHIIDFGGGYGRLAIALAERYPKLKITVADLPAVCIGTRARINAGGLGERIDCMPVDFFCDNLPNNAADAILFVRVLHDWNDNQIANLIKRTRSSLKKEGIVLVVETMTDENVNLDPSFVLSSLMITLFGGRRRSVQEYIKILQSAGYRELFWRDCGLSIYKMVVARI